MSFWRQGVEALPRARQRDLFKGSCPFCGGVGVVFFAVEPALGRSWGRLIYQSCTRCHESGEANYVGKPLRMARLYEVRSRWVKGRWVKGRKLVPLKGSL